MRYWMACIQQVRLLAIHAGFSMHLSRLIRPSANARQHGATCEGALSPLGIGRLELRDDEFAAVTVGLAQPAN